MRHDAQCELTPGANQPSCQCAQRAFLATATDDEKGVHTKCQQPCMCDLCEETP